MGLSQLDEEDILSERRRTSVRQRSLKWLKSRIKNQKTVHLGRFSSLKGALILAFSCIFYRAAFVLR